MIIFTRPKLGINTTEKLPSNSDFFNTDDTIIALATPSGVGAIAVIRLSGKESIQIVNQIFHGKNLEKQDTHTVHFGTIRKDEKIIDEVLTTVFHEGRSYTKENSIEISTHGSPFIIQEVIKLLLDNGVRMAQPGEFTKRAFLNGQFDLSQAEAVADLIHSDSPTSHENAMKQMRGGFSSDISILRSQLIKFASLIELELDFSEEDVEFADRSQLIELINQINIKLDSLLKSFELGNVIKKGVPVAIVGRPNAGKSTLLNSLLNEDRAIVSDIAGTTRDTIEESLTIEGIQFRFIDTAGIRETSDTIEKIGVEKALEQIDKSSIYIYLFDINELTPSDLKDELSKLDASKKRLIIANKTDLASQEIKDDFQDYADNMLFISAKEKNSLEQIKDALSNAVNYESADSEQSIVTNVRHFESLRNTKNSLQEVLNAIETGLGGDLLSIDIKNALHHLGSITGEISTDDLLDSIFRDFCIGK